MRGTALALALLLAAGAARAPAASAPTPSAPTPSAPAPSAPITPTQATPSQAAPIQATRHFAPNANFLPDGTFAPAAAGFDLADISAPDQLPQLPPGVAALVWVGRCAGADAPFRATLTPFLHDPRVFAFYLMDDPDPRPLHPGRCKPQALREEADWIHASGSKALAFIALMNLGTRQQPDFSAAYSPAATHLDLYGIDPYPCRTSLAACDMAMIDRYVAAAHRAGIADARIVPVFQTFGGGTWRDGEGGYYRLPTAAEETGMLRRWHRLVPAPAFDYAYSWGAQRADTALAGAADLQAVLRRHNLTGEP